MNFTKTLVSALIAGAIVSPAAFARSAEKVRRTAHTHKVAPMKNSKKEESVKPKTAKKRSFGKELGTGSIPAGKRRI